MKKIIFLIVILTLTSCGENSSYFAKKVETASLDAAPGIDPADAGGEGEGEETPPDPSTNPTDPKPAPGPGPGNPPDSQPGSSGPGKEKCPPKVGDEDLKKDPSLWSKIACAKGSGHERYAVCHQTDCTDEDNNNDERHDKIVFLLLPQSGAQGHLGAHQGDDDVDHHEDFLLDCSKMSEEQWRNKKSAAELCKCED